MSSRLSARQNKTRLIAVFLFTVVMALLFQVFKGQFESRGSAVSNAEMLDDAMFMGLRRAKPSEIKAALPEAKGKPIVLAFSSRFCHDCQRMAPVLSEVISNHPNLYYKKMDVLEDQKKYPAIFNALKPVSVPVLIMISPNGAILNVLYNYQKPEVVAAAIRKLERQSLQKADRQ